MVHLSEILLELSSFFELWYVHGLLCHTELRKTIGVRKEKVILTPEAHALHALATFWVRKQ